MSKRVGQKRSALQRLSENMNSISSTINSKMAKPSSKIKVKQYKKLKLKPDPIASFLKFKPSETNESDIIGESSKPNTNKRLPSRTWMPPLKGNDFPENHIKQYLAKNNLKMECVTVVSVEKPSNTFKSIARVLTTSSTCDVNKVTEKMNCEIMNSDVAKNICNSFHEVHEQTIGDTQLLNITTNCESNTDILLTNTLTNSPILELVENYDTDAYTKQTEQTVDSDDTKKACEIKHSEDVNHGYIEHKLKSGFNKTFSDEENHSDERISSLESQETIFNPSNTVIIDDPINDVELPELIKQEGKSQNVTDQNNNNTFSKKRLDTNNDKTSTKIKMIKNTQPTDLKEMSECNNQFSEIDQINYKNENEISVVNSQRAIFIDEGYELDDEDDIFSTDKINFTSVKNTAMFENDNKQEQEVNIESQKMLTPNYENSQKSTTSYFSDHDSKFTITGNNSPVRSHVEKSLQLQINIDNSTCTQHNNIFQSETNNGSISSCKSVKTNLSQIDVQETYGDCTNDIGDNNEIKSCHIATQDTVIIEETSFEKAESKNNLHNSKSHSLNSETDSISNMSHQEQINTSQESKLNNSMKYSTKESLQLAHKDVTDISHVSNDDINDTISSNECVIKQKNYEDLMDCNDDFYDIHMSEVIKIENEYKETNNNMTKIKLQSLNDYDSNKKKQTSQIVKENLASVSTHNNYIASPIPHQPRLDWIKKQNEQKQKLRSIIQEIKALNSMVLQARKEIWPKQFNMQNK